MFAKVNQKTVSNLEGEISSLSIVNSDDTSYYYDIWIQEDGNFTGGGFFADFAIVWGGRDYIMNVRDQGIWAVGGSYSFTYLGIDRVYEEQYTGRPALARLSWEYYPLGTGGATYRTYLYVGNNMYWSELG